MESQIPLPGGELSGHHIVPPYEVRIGRGFENQRVVKTEATVAKVHDVLRFYHVCSRSTYKPTVKDLCYYRALVQIPHPWGQNLSSNPLLTRTGWGVA